MKFNKLVRDKIPQIIESQGELPIFRTLDPEEYIQCLETKLDEEVCEYHEGKNLEELDDILEVIFALAEANGYSKENLLSAYREKHEMRGGFSDRIFLIAKQ